MTRAEETSASPLLEDPTLSPDQKRAEKEILDFARTKMDEAATGAIAMKAPRVSAVVGNRGSGKSTVLHRVGAALAAERELCLCSQVVDASTIRDDLGIMAAALQEIRATVLERAGGVNPPGASSTSPLDHDLRETFDRIFESVLLDEESHRRLAQELAMSPGHYAKIIYDAAQRKRNNSTDFKAFVDALLAVERRRQRNEGLGPMNGDQRLVVVLDDLDLAGAGGVLNWARGLLTHYYDPRIVWILGFDRDRLIRLLAQPLPDESPSSAEANGAEAGGGGLDLTTGRALLQKLVPVYRQWELRRWAYDQRKEFRPLEAADAPTVGTLIERNQCPHLLPLLPSFPRALEGVYKAMADEEQRNEDDEGELLHDIHFLRRVALGEGEDRLLEELDLRGVGPFAEALRWRPEDELTEPRWGAVVDSAKKALPLSGLPVPEELRRVVTTPAPEAFLEVIVDIALSQGHITPHRLLTRMPFTRVRVETAAARLRMPQLELAHALTARNPYGDPGTSKGYPPLLQGRALFWQRWNEQSDAEKFWEFQVGPLPLWRAFYEGRDPVPDQLYSALILNPPPIESADRRSMEEASDILPRRLRALLLLVDRLSAMPWRKFEDHRSFWHPQVYTQLVTLATLRGYLPPSVGPGDELWKLGDPERLLQQVQQDSEERVAQEFEEWLEKLSRRIGSLKGQATSRRTPTGSAERELLEALDNLRRLPMVQGLATAHP